MNRQWCHTAGTANVISHFVAVEAERMLAITQGFKIRFGRVLAPCGDLWELVRGDGSPCPLALFQVQELQGPLIVPEKPGRCFYWLVLSGVGEHFPLVLIGPPQLEAAEVRQYSLLEFQDDHKEYIDPSAVLLPIIRLLRVSVVVSQERC